MRSKQYGTCGSSFSGAAFHGVVTRPLQALERFVQENEDFFASDVQARSGKARIDPSKFGGWRLEVSLAFTRVLGDSAAVHFGIDVAGLDSFVCDDE